ncbi:MAG: hypothetical protein ACK5HP_00220 [Bacilli bacterium]
MSGYVISDIQPTNNTKGQEWMKIDLTSSTRIMMETTSIPIGTTYQNDGSNWNRVDTYIYSSRWIKFSNSTYSESILNGSAPIIGTNMIPVTIADNGDVTYANIKTEWYNYSKKYGQMQ